MARWRETQPTTTSGGEATAGSPALPATTSTRALLACLAAAAPLFTVTVVAQMLTRSGFHLQRNQASLLTNGALGWIQVANFVVTGVLLLAGAAGMRRVMRGSRGGTWGPALMAVFAVGTIAAGVFRPDPMFGFPPGAPPGAPDHPSWHSNLHFAVASLSFLALIMASLVTARGFAAHGRTGWAASSVTVGVVALGASVVQAAAANHGPVNAIFLVAILLGYGWVSALAAWLWAQLPSAPPA